MRAEGEGATPNGQGSAPPGEGQTRVLALLERYGAHATSFQVLERGMAYWFDGQGDAVVAYVDAAGTWLAAGPPIAAPERMGKVAEGFIAAAAAAGRRAAFFSVDDDFLAALSAHGRDFDVVPIGEQADFDLSRYDVEGTHRRALRAQIRRAFNKGVRVRRLAPDALAPRRRVIEGLIARWLATRRMSAMRFLVDLEPFGFAEARRYYVAERAGQLVGFLSAVPVYARRGWFFEDLIRAPDAPNGTAELLVHEAMLDAADAGSAFASLGLSPLSGITTEPGPHRALRRFLRFCYDHLGSLYRFAGVRSFKARFRPDHWAPQYLVSWPPHTTGRALCAVLSAFAGGHPFRFALATVRHLLTRALDRRSPGA